MCQKRRPRILLADEDLRLVRLAEAPQVASTCQLDASIDLAILALLAAHPDLKGGAAVPELDGAEPAVCIADAIILHARALQIQLDRYHQTFLTENNDSFE
jgi:hypothetical protein